MSPSQRPTDVQGVGTHVKISSVPQTYRGVRFRSTLEADWAATLDSVCIAWSYEPEAVKLPSGEFYRPDFWLPELQTWFEVKGPHNERIEKTRELHAAGPREVVVGRAPVYGKATFEFGDGDTGNCVLQYCITCEHFTWINEGSAWFCQYCRIGGKASRQGHMFVSPTVRGAWVDADHLPFTRARRAA